ELHQAPEDGLTQPYLDCVAAFARDYLPGEFAVRDSGSGETVITYLPGPAAAEVRAFLRRWPSAAQLVDMVRHEAAGTWGGRGRAAGHRPGRRARPPRLHRILGRSPAGAGLSPPRYRPVPGPGNGPCIRGKETAMAPRVDSELLLVGSLPADSADSALRAAAAFYDGLVFALPDGETGPRSAWVGYERERLVRPNPDVVVVQETESPTGIPRHAYETPVFGIRPGTTALHWDSWPRIDDAIAGYQVFRALRA